MLEFPAELKVYMKYLLLIALVVAVLLVLRKMQGSGRRDHVSQSPSHSERMVACAHCGVNQPVGECVLGHDHYYCCNAHRQEAESQGG
jgi:uncharacterized protein